MQGFLLGCVLILLGYGTYKWPVFGLIVLALLAGCAIAWYEIVRPRMEEGETSPEYRKTLEEDPGNEEKVLQPMRDRSKKLRRLQHHAKREGRR